MSIFLVRQKFRSFLRYVYIIHIYMYVYKSFPTTFDKDLRKNIKKKEEMEKLENINNKM